MRTLSSTVIEGLHKLNQRGAWCYLLDIVINSSTTERLTTHSHPITYNNITYQPFPIIVGEIRETSKPEMKTFQVQVANIDRKIASYLESGYVIGNDITLTKIFLNRGET